MLPPRWLAWSKLTDILLASAQTVQQREWAYEELTDTLRRCGRHGDAQKALQQAEGLSVLVGELQDLDRKADAAARKGKYAVQEGHLRKRLRLLAAQGDREGATRVEQAILRSLCDQARWSDAELLIEGLVTATKGAVAAQRLAIGLDAVTIYRKLRRLGDARRWADEACAVAADLPGRDQARALAHRAVVDLAQGDAKTAQKGFRTALCLTRQPDGDVVARLFPADHDTPDQALALFEDLVGHASGYATQPRPGGWLAGIGNAYLPQGRFLTAEKCFAAALDIAQQSNDAEEFRDYLLVGLGAACAGSDPQRARQCLENALNGAQARNDSVCGAMANWNLANLLVDAGQTRRAAELYDQAEGVLAGQYDTEQAGVLIASSLCFVALSDTAAALKALGKADKLLRRWDEPRWRGVAAVARGFTHIAAKDYSAANRDLQQGRKLAATAGDLSSQGRADCYLGLVAALTGKKTATSSFSRAEPVLREIGDLQGLEILKACRHALDQGNTESQLAKDSRCIEARLIHAWIRSAN